jgi:transcriptional regulator with XRE-family HTH domain
MKTSRTIEAIHVPAVENSPDVKCAMWVGTRDEIIERLRQLPEALDKSDTEIAQACGINPSTWSNYKSRAASKNIIVWGVALELWNAYAIPMEWIYDGQVSRVPDPELREKLAVANRAAMAEAASKRIRPHSKRH